MKLDANQLIKTLQARKGLSRADAIATAVRSGQIALENGKFVMKVSQEESGRLAKAGEAMMTGVKRREAPHAQGSPKVPMTEQKKAMNVVDVQTPSQEVVTKKKGTAEYSGTERKAAKTEFAGPERRAAAARAIDGVEDVGMVRKILRKLFKGSYNPALDLMNLDQIRDIMNQGPKPGQKRTGTDA